MGIRSSKPDKPFAWLIPSLFIGVLLAIPTLVLKNLTHQFWLVGVITVGVFWALITSFKKRWHQARFWNLIAVCFALHCVLLNFLSIKITFDFRSAALIGVFESVVFWLLVAVILGGVKFYDEE